MFNRTIQLKLAKTPHSTGLTVDSDRMSKVDYEKFLHHGMTDLVQGIVTIMAAKIFMDTLSKIAINRFSG